MKINIHETSENQLHISLALSESDMHKLFTAIYNYWRSKKTNPQLTKLTATVNKRQGRVHVLHTKYA